MTEPRVRLATRDDADTIARVHVASWQATYRGVVPDRILDNLSVERRAGFWRDVIDEAAHPVWVGLLRDRVVGFVNAGAASDDDLVGAGEIHAIYVAPEAWSRGVGRLLFGTAATELAARGLSPLVLWVLTDNSRGRRFYDAAGWAPDAAARTLDFDGEAIEEIRYRAP